MIFLLCSPRITRRLIDEQLIDALTFRIALSSILSRTLSGPGSLSLVLHSRRASAIQIRDGHGLGFHNPTQSKGGSIAEWLACWTQKAHKGPGSNRSNDAVG